MVKPSTLPLRITLCVVLVLIFTAWSFVRLITSINWAARLESYAGRPGAVYIGLTGGIWSLAGLLILWAIWQRKRWALRAMLVTAWLYAAWAWCDRILLQGGGSPNWRFMLIGTVVLLGLVSATTLDHRNRRYFGEEAHEREPQDPSSA